MKLWLLEAREDLSKDQDPWEPWYDKTFGVVVRAKCEESARKLASTVAGDEKRNCADAWLSDKYSTCNPLVSHGEEEVIIRDHASA